ncbi:unnamed protein product [Rhizoctonia solani]|uniref:MYND-type domain-containing protein n=1 Tax=Rhizoctonia solani TaxID=456999 RepID=A0A8H3B2W0_9AGAM|nr:unnamed protein product [Rhizoctonia solani]CAE6446115.1 unnamed protein product [Rhizoctonia solani]
MVPTIPENAVFELKSDPRARSRAVAARTLEAGSIILVEAPLAVAIHPSYKGRRCDGCLRELDNLHKCSGCGVYWYCGVACQNASWKRHHRRLCGFSKTYASSSAYNDATEETQADMCLLAHLAAEHFYKCDTLKDAQASSNPTVQTFWDLLQSAQPHAGQNLISPLSFTSSGVLSAAASRFGNNNFVIHDARLVPFAHGVFATASRSFNHSCRPNAVAMFEESANGVQMVIKLIEDVVTGEEVRNPFVGGVALPEPGQQICISYTDPASPDSKRRDALQHAYGFVCQCPRCITGTSAAPRSPGDEPILRSQIETIVQEHLQNSASSLETVRNALASVSLESQLLDFLPNWAADFSKSSHDGPYDQALQHGNAVLGVYLLVYAGSYPLLELHCLELCKVAWNLYITTARPGSRDQLHVKHASMTYLRNVYRKIDSLGKCNQTNKESHRSKASKQSQTNRTHVKEFFDNYYPAFKYQKSKPAVTQFKELKKEYREYWDKEDLDKAREAFKDALTKDFNDTYGTDENDLASWQKLCTVLNMKNIPDDLELCRKVTIRVKSTYVNLVDLVDTPYTGKPVRDFKSEAKLSEYTKKEGKYFLRDNVNAGDLLKYLLRQIIVPGKGKRYPRRKQAKKKHLNQASNALIS